MDKQQENRLRELAQSSVVGADIRAALDEIDALRNRSTSPSPAEVSSEGMTAQELADDDALRFIQRVLESNAPEADRKAARDMALEMRMRFRQQSPARVAGELTYAISAAEAVRKSLADKYQQGIDTNSADMGGNCDWARLEGAVKVITALRALNQRLAVKEGEAVGQITVEYISADSDDKKLTAMTWSEAAIPAGTHDIYIAPLSTHPVSDDQQAKDAALVTILRKAYSVLEDKRGSQSGFWCEELMEEIDAALSTTKQEG